LIRKLFSLVYTKLVHFLFDSKIKDFQCGFKGFNRTRILPILDGITQKQWLWDTELILKLESEGVKIREIPVLIRELRERHSRVRLFRDSFSMGIGLLKLYTNQSNKANITDYFDRQVQHYEKRQKGLLGWWVAKEIKLAAEMVQIRKDQNVLDAGCGTGEYSNIIKKKGGIPYGVDLSTEMIRSYVNRGYSGTVGDIEKIDLKKRFDTIILSGSLEFSRRPEVLISNMTDHLNENGTIIMTYPKRNIFGLLYKI